MTCVREMRAGGALAAGRCRPRGDCLEDSQCASAPREGSATPSCRRSDLTCQPKCRQGIDPTTGQLYADCANGMVCIRYNGGTTCARP
jgi:hypothetical protein